jgi:hypothetical protein
VRFAHNGRETAEKIVPVGVVSKDDGRVAPSSHDVVDGTGGVYKGILRHILMIGRKLKN